MARFFTFLKDALFGIVACLWGVSLVFSTQLSNEQALHLLYVSFSIPVLGIFFIAAGTIHVVSKMFPDPLFAAFANICLSSVFMIVMLTHIFASFYMIAWIAFAAIMLNLLINAFLLLKNT